jgi:hypothetical protein
MVKPNEVQAIESAKLAVSLATRTVVCEGLVTGVEEVARAEAAIAQERQRAIGNRPGGRPLEWSVVRMALIATLRRCLQELGEDVPEHAGPVEIAWGQCPICGPLRAGGYSWHDSAGVAHPCCSWHCYKVSQANIYQAVSGHTGRPIDNRVCVACGRLIPDAQGDQLPLVGLHGWPGA